MGVGTGSVEEWFKSGERVSVTFHVSDLDTAVRTQHVCCHVIEPPLTTRHPRPHKHTPTNNNANSQGTDGNTTTIDSTGANAAAGAAAAGTAGAEGAAAVVAGEQRGSGGPAQGAAVERSSSNVHSSQGLVQQDEEEEEEEEEDVPAVTFLHGYPTSSFDYSKVIEILSRTPASDLLAAAAKSAAAAATAAPATGSKAAAGAPANGGGSDATAQGHTNGVHEKSEGAPQSHSSSHSDLTGLSGLAALGCRCILIDLLGYGNSDKGVGEARFSVQQQANLITQVWQHYGVTRTHLVAHDFSVSVAQELLMREPKDRLGGVELGKVLWLNGSVFVDLYAPLAVEKLLGQRATGWAAGAVMGRAAFCALLSQKFSREHPAAQQVLDDAYWAMCQNGGQKILHKLTRYMKDRERYKRVWQGALELAMRRDPKRMLFFWGMQDPVSGAHIAAQLHARFDRYGHPGLIQEHADLGHWPHVEDPHRVAAALLAFFTEGGEGGSAAWRHYLPSPKPFELDLHIEICSIARGRFSTDGAAPGTSAGGGATTSTGTEVAGSTHGGGGGGGGGGFFMRRSVEISRRSVEAYRKQASSTLTGRTSLHHNGSMETSRHGRTSAPLFNRTSAQKLSRAPSGNTSGLLAAAASALGIGAAAGTPGAAVQATEPPPQTTTTTIINNNNSSSSTAGTKPTANLTSAAANSSSTWHAAPAGADALAAGVVGGEVGGHPAPLGVAAEQVRSASSTPQGSSSNVALPGQAI